MRNTTRSLPDLVLQTGDYTAVAAPTFTFAVTAVSGTVVSADLSNPMFENSTGTYTSYTYNPNTLSAMTVRIYNVINVGASSVTNLVASIACPTGVVTTQAVTGIFAGDSTYATCTNTSAVSSTNLTVSSKLMSYI